MTGQICKAANGTAEAAGTAVDFGSDPVGYIADRIRDALATAMRYFAGLVNETSKVDWTNPGFLRTYSMMFGLSAIVTAILWLLAVAKRAVAGVPPLIAASESIGYLVLAVTVTAFAPAVVYQVTNLFDAAADAMFAPALGDISALEGTLLKAWAVVAALGGGQLMLVTFGLFVLFAVVSVWVELVIRAALIYIALALGPLVFSGLVDRALWKHTRRWTGAVAAIIMVKPVTLTVLVLGTGLLANARVGNSSVQAIAVLVQASGLFFVAFLVPLAIGRFVPAFGDDLAAVSASRRSAQERIGDAAPQARSAAEEMAAKTQKRAGALAEGMRQGGADDRAKSAARTGGRTTGGSSGGSGGGTAPHKPTGGTGQAAKTGSASGSATQAGAFTVGGAGSPFVETIHKAAQSGAERATASDPGQAGTGPAAGGTAATAPTEPPPDPPSDPHPEGGDRR